MGTTPDETMAVLPHFQAQLELSWGPFSIGGDLKRTVRSVTPLLPRRQPSQRTRRITGRKAALRSFSYASKFAPQFSINNASICVGQLLGTVLHSTLGHAYDKVLKPLEPFIGQDGMLMKRLEVISLFLSSLSSLINFTRELSSCLDAL